MDSTARAAVCVAARDLAEATFVVLFEPDAGRRRLITTASDGIDLRTEIPLGQESSACAAAFLSGRSIFVADCAVSPLVSRRLVAATGAVSLLLRPVLKDGAAVGVLAIGFDRGIRALPERLDEVLTVVAAEAALAVERADLLARLALAAHTDGLTGADNRRGWELAVERDLAGTSTRPAVVALLDLDHFKDFNDAHGHQTGDFLLQTCVRLWRAELRVGDTLARWGGEEFAVLLPGCTQQTAAAVLDRLRRVVPAGCTVSIGVTGCRAGEAAGTVMARADEAMYEAKRSGRDRVVWHRPEARVPEQPRALPSAAVPGEPPA